MRHQFEIKLNNYGQLIEPDIYRARVAEVVAKMEQNRTIDEISEGYRQLNKLYGQLEDKRKELKRNALDFEKQLRELNAPLVALRERFKKALDEDKDNKRKKLYDDVKVALQAKYEDLGAIGDVTDCIDIIPFVKISTLTKTGNLSKGADELFTELYKHKQAEIKAKNDATRIIGVECAKHNLGIAPYIKLYESGTEVADILVTIADTVRQINKDKPKPKPTGDGYGVNVTLKFPSREVAAMFAEFCKVNNVQFEIKERFK